MSGPEASGPGVSVCVATYRRPAQLARLLGQLSRLEPPEGGYEVVVVDDGSPASDGVDEVLRAAQRGFPVPLRWRSLPANRGRAAARNAAWRMARGGWVAFTDDDCRPDPGWLVEMLAAAAPRTASGEVPGIVQGRTIPDPEREDLLCDPLSRSLRVERWSDQYETANIAYRRCVLMDLGGFDEGFPGAGEDTDLGWRAAARGVTGVFSPAALVVHDVAVRSFAQDLRDRRRWGDLVKVVKRHPETRRLAWRRYVLRRSHVVPILVMGALPLLAPRRTRLLGVGGLAALLTQDLRGARSPRAVVRRLQQRVGDAYEVISLARSSLRHRTVLL